MIQLANDILARRLIREIFGPGDGETFRVILTVESCSHLLNVILTRWKLFSSVKRHSILMNVILTS